MKVVYSWLEYYVGKELPAPEKIEELLSLHAFEIEEVTEVAGEVVIDVDVLPNRAADALSHRGIAREIATILGVSLIDDPLRGSAEFVALEDIVINIADTAACPRFTASLITDVEVKESPKWLQQRLEAMGQRPINNIVDATNYVMYALGQPMHAYDADKFPKVDGVWQFGVRYAKGGETIALLPESTKDEDRVVELTGSELLIVDGSTDIPVGLAGIKGGRHAELDADTTNVIIEAASFHPTVIRKTARRLGILTDASKRFENAPSAKLPLYAQREIIALITKIANGKFVGLAEAGEQVAEAPTVTVMPERVNALLGLSLRPKEIVDIIARTGATVVALSDGTLQATGPWERKDLLIEEDYIEEVGRIYGLANIESVKPEERAITEVNMRQYYSERVRQALLAVGFSEVITSSFQKKGKIQLQNALASDKSYLRESLKKNIAGVLDANYVHTDLLGLSDVRVFEIGTVFEKTESGVSEHLSLALGARTKGNGYSLKDDQIVTLGQEAVAKALDIELSWVVEKGIAELDLSAVIGDLTVQSVYEQLPERKDISYTPISQYPAIARDVALWVASDEEAIEVATVLVGAAGELLVRHTLFDTFEKEGRTSYAFRLVFQSNVRTLTDSEVNGIMEHVYKAVTEQGWEAR
jgi:phenylalanyl-tRNA synthetase beta chain